MNIFSRLPGLKKLSLKKKNLTVKGAVDKDITEKIEENEKPTVPDDVIGTIIGADDKVKKFKRPPDAEIPPQPKPKHEKM